MPNNLFSADAQAQLKALKKQLETKKSDMHAVEKPDQPVNLPSQKQIDKQVKAHLQALDRKADSSQTNQNNNMSNDISFAELAQSGRDQSVDTDALADELLFKQAMSGVVPLQDKNTVTPTELAAQKSQSSKAQNATALAKRAAAQGGTETANDLPISDMQAMLNPVASEAYLMYKNPTLQHRVFSQLKDGKLRWFDAVDIHGSTVEEARAAVLRVIQMTQQNGHTVLKIVHGKGKDAVLKTCVNGWLRQHPDVLAFCSATPKDGGTGAVVVLIKRPDDSKQKR